LNHIICLLDDSDTYAYRFGEVFSSVVYQTQSHHPIILDSDPIKNFQGLTLALNDIVHLYSTQ